MMKNRILTAALLFVLSCGWGLWADAAVSLDEYVALVLEHNADIRQAEESVEDAAENLGIRIELENTRISLGGSVRYGPNMMGDSEATWSTDASVSVPVIPQVSVGGRIDPIGAGDTEVTGSLSLTLNPFATGLSNPADREAYDKAALNLIYTKSRIVLNAENAGFGILLRQAEWKQVEADLAYQQSRYDVVKQRYEIGDATYEEYQEAMSSLSSARRSAFDAEKRLLTARKDLQLLLGPEVDMAEIETITLDEMQLMIEQRRSLADAAAASGPPTSQSLEQAEVELRRLEEDLRQTWLWRPNLAVSVSAGVPLEDVQASISLSFSPGELKIDERNDLQESIEDKLDEIVTERFTIDVERQLQLANVAMAEEALEIAMVELEQSRLSLEEAEELYQQGYLTELELEQNRLQLSSAENRAFSSAYDLYAVLGELLSFFGGL
jgi:outer membrane protein TolC